MRIIWKEINVVGAMSGVEGTDIFIDMEIVRIQTNECMFELDIKVGNSEEVRLTMAANFKVELNKREQNESDERLSYNFSKIVADEIMPPIVWCDSTIKAMERNEDILEDEEDMMIN